MSQRTTSKTSIVEKSEVVSKSAISSCEHQSEEDGPCSVCKPPETLVKNRLVSPTWKHMPWDDVELKKHGILVVDDDKAELDKDRPDLLSIEEQLKRSMRLGDDESSNELENWPQVAITNCRVMSDEDVPPPPMPNFSSTHSSEDDTPLQFNDRQAAAPPSSTEPVKDRRPTRSAQKGKGRSKSIFSKTIERRQSQRIVVPYNKRGGRRCIEIDFNVQVQIDSRKRAASTSRIEIGNKKK